MHARFVFCCSGEGGEDRPEGRSEDYQDRARSVGGRGTFMHTYMYAHVLYMTFTCARDMHICVCS